MMGFGENCAFSDIFLGPGKINYEPKIDAPVYLEAQAV
jgi:hypothetical protein